MRSEPGAQSSERTFARFDVVNGGAKIGEVEPHTDVYPASGATVRAVIMGGWRHDLFVVADQPFDPSSGEIALRVVVFPLVRLVWLGAILLCVGAMVSLWPRGRTQEQEARATQLGRSRSLEMDGASI
jgi:cytochrome c biogenesis factor